MKSVSISELNRSLESASVIDVREDYEYQSGRVPGSKNIPIRDLAFNHTKYLEKGKEYYVICQSGSRSTQLISYLDKEGYDLINVLGGTGMYGLQYPLER
ncbi:rhodanese-like domain-containing protein [Mycoplasmatota bacterium zrk1]